MNQVHDPIARLGLARHPEGGLHRETWRAARWLSQRFRSVSVRQRTETGCASDSTAIDNATPSTPKEPTMNTPLNHRLAAAIASVAITFVLFSAVAGQAEPPVAGSVLAQAATAAVVR